MALVAVHSATTLGLAQMDPIGRAVTGSREPLLIHKGFQQHGSTLEGHFPVAGKLLGCFAQHMAGQPLYLDPGQQKEAGGARSQFWTINWSLSLRVSRSQPIHWSRGARDQTGEENCRQPRIRGSRLSLRIK